MLSLESKQETTTTTTSNVKKVGVALACTALVGAATVLVASQSSSSEASNAMLLKIPTEFKGRISAQGLHGDYKLMGDFEKYENDMGDWVIDGKAVATGDRVWGSTHYTLKGNVIMIEQKDFLGKTEANLCFDNQRFPAYGQIPASLASAVVVENFELDHDVQDRIAKDCAADSTKSVMMWQNMPYTLCYEGGSAQSVQVFGKNFDARIVQDDTLDELYQHVDGFDEIYNCTEWDPLRTFEEVTAPHTAPKRVLKASTEYWPFQGHTEHSADKILAHRKREARRELGWATVDMPAKADWGAHLGTISDAENDASFRSGNGPDWTAITNDNAHNMVNGFPTGNEATKFTLRFNIACQMTNARPRDATVRRELGDEGGSNSAIGQGDWEPALGMPPRYRAQLSQAESSLPTYCPQYYPETMRDLFEKAAAEAGVPTFDFHSGVQVDVASNSVTYAFDTGNVSSQSYLAGLSAVMNGESRGDELFDQALNAAQEKERSPRRMAEVDKLVQAMFSPSLDELKDSRELPVLAGGTISTPYPPIPTPPPTPSPPSIATDTPYPQMSCYFVHGSGGRGMFQRSGGYCADDVVTWKNNRVSASVAANTYPTEGNYHTKFSGLDIPLSAAYVHTAGQQACHTRPNGPSVTGSLGNSARQGNPAVGQEADGYEYKYWGGWFLHISYDKPVTQWNDFPCNDVITVDTDSRLRAYKNANYLEEFCNLIEWGRTKTQHMRFDVQYKQYPRVHNGDPKHQFVITQSNGGPVVSQAFRVGDAGGGCDKSGLYYFASNPPLKGSKAGNFVSFACAAPQAIALHLGTALFYKYPKLWLLLLNPKTALLVGIALLTVQVIVLLLGNTIMQGLKDGAYCAPNTAFGTAGNKNSGGKNGGNAGKWWDVSLNSRSWPVFQGLRQHTDNAWELGHQPTQAAKADAKMCGTSPVGLGVGSWKPLWGISLMSYLEQTWDSTCVKYATSYMCGWRGCASHISGQCVRVVGWRDNNDGMVPLNSCTAGFEQHLIIQATNHQDGCATNGDDWMNCGPVCYIKRALREAKWKSNVRWCQFYNYSVVAYSDFWNNSFPQGGPCPCSAHKNLNGARGDGSANNRVAACT